MGELDFQWALTQLKAGRRVTRYGWNGKQMYITLQDGYPDGMPINGNTAKATGIQVGTVKKFLPYIMMKTADDKFVPWTASNTDILTNDWQVL